MKRYLAALMALCLVFCFAACGKQKTDDTNNSQPAGDLEAVIESGTINVGILPGPYFKDNGDGSYSGFYIDVLNTVCEQLVIKYSVVPVADEAAGVELLNGGSIDCLWGVVYSSAMAQNENCSAPFVYTDCVALMKTDIANRYPTVISLKSLKAVGAVENSLAFTAATNAGLNPVISADITELLAKVSSGSVEAAVVHFAEAVPYTDNSDFIPLSVSAVIESFGYGTLYRDNSTLMPKIRVEIKKLTENGSLDTLADKYGIATMLTSNRG